MSIALAFKTEIQGQHAYNDTVTLRRLKSEARDAYTVDEDSEHMFGVFTFSDGSRLALRVIQNSAGDPAFDCWDLRPPTAATADGPPVPSA